MPKVETTHPDFDRFAPLWTLMRDTVAGEDRVKAATARDLSSVTTTPRYTITGTQYLPMPGGMSELSAEGTAEAYWKYKLRAQFPEIVASTIRGLAGVIHANPFTIQLPEALEPLREQATRSGLDLEALHRRVTREMLEMGRFGILADMPSEGGDLPFLATYQAESIINWDEGPNGAYFVVLDESANERDPETWAWETVNRWREVVIEDGRLVVRVYESNENGVAAKVGEDIMPTLRGGAVVDFLPFTFIDTNDLTPEPDEVPMIGLARKALAIYRKSADYEQALYMTSQPTPVITGLTVSSEHDETPTTLGSAKPWVFSSPETKAFYLEFGGAGIASQRQAIMDDLEQAVQHGTRMFGSEGRQAESGEALRIRRATETATLASIAKNSAAGLQQALRHAAMWIGADPERVIVEPPESLVDESLTPEELNSLVKGWMDGAYSWGTLFENLQRGGIIDRDKTLEEEQKALEDEEFDDREPPTPELAGMLQVPPVPVAAE
jgi:hypothetical protein